MATDAERNKQIVLEFMDAFTTFDPERYESFLTEHPVYQVGMTVHEGREGFADVARFGRVLYPNGQDRRTLHHVLAEGDVVSILLTVDAVTNSGASYTNDYALFFELEDGKIAKQVEILDFRVSADKFDLSALA
jgi:ketosteroid isomerase-like protein